MGIDPLFCNDLSCSPGDYIGFLADMSPVTEPVVMHMGAPEVWILVVWLVILPNLLVNAFSGVLTQYTNHLMQYVNKAET